MLDIRGTKVAQLRESGMLKAYQDVPDELLIEAAAQAGDRMGFATRTATTVLSEAKTLAVMSVNFDA